MTGSRFFAVLVVHPQTWAYATHHGDTPPYHHVGDDIDWCRNANPTVSTEDFVNVFSCHGIRLSQVRALRNELDALSQTDRAFAIELIIARAFSRNELLNPGVILAYFARTDWAEITKIWQHSGTRHIRHIVKHIDHPPPKPHVTTRGNGPSPTTMLEKELDPVRAAIHDALTGKRKKQAANCEVALQVLADHPTLSWTAERIAVQVMARRKSCGTTFTTPDALACLKQLEQSGLVTQDGTNFRHKPRA